SLGKSILDCPEAPSDQGSHGVGRGRNPVAPPVCLMVEGVPNCAAVHHRPKRASKVSSVGGGFQPPPTSHMGQNKLTIRQPTIGLIVFGVLIVLIGGIFAAVAALQW